MYCKNCGSSIDDNAVICPHCGVATHGSVITQQEKTNVMAIVGLILAFIFPIAGLICSIIGRKQCKTTGENGMGLATAGMIISIVELAIAVIVIFIYIITIATFAASLS